MRWAALLHDLGKPDTRVERDGEGTFYGHEILGAEIADRVLERLRHPHDERRAIVHLVREHMFDYRPEWSDAALRRWLRRIGVDAVADLFDLRLADNLGNGKKTGFPHYLEEMRERIERLIAMQREVSRNLRVLGIGPGPEVGRALDALLERVLDHPEQNTRDTLLAELEARTGRE